MLLAASAIKVSAIQATDGRITWVDNTFFDDQSWKIRWLVIKPARGCRAKRFSSIPPPSGRLISPAMS